MVINTLYQQDCNHSQLSKYFGVGCGFSPAFCFCKDVSWAKATAYDSPH